MRPETQQKILSALFGLVMLLVLYGKVTGKN